MLGRQKIPHNVLNAKYHQREAEIVARAGQHSAVTIARIWRAAVPTSSSARAWRLWADCMYWQ